MTADDFRKMALDIPDAVEQAHMGHPDFRLGGKIFASLGFPNDDYGMVKLTPDEQASFIDQRPKMFQPSSGAWGRQGCTSVHLTSATKALVRSALLAASKNVAPAKPKRKNS
jgi:hypothetical protein